jgi:2'-5' RNA ligase
MLVRTFIALELSGALKKGILNLAKELERRGVRASWARAGTLHLTLKFLGDVEEALIPDVVAAIARAASEVSPFAFDSLSVGAFPSPRRPRIIWLGVEPVDELYELQGAIEQELTVLGFPRERRRFKPHITIARLREPLRLGDDRETGGILTDLAAPDEKTWVDEVAVIKSTLAGGGAIHECLAVVPLGGTRGSVHR